MDVFRIGRGRTTLWELVPLNLSFLMTHENCENCPNCLNKFCPLDMKRVSFSAVAGNKRLKEMNYFSKGISMTI